MSMSLHVRMSVNGALTECQQSINNFHICIFFNLTAILLHIPIIKDLLTLMGNIGRVDVATPQMRIMGALTILGIAPCIIQGLCSDIYA
jgi:hypothetical protein